MTKSSEVPVISLWLSLLIPQKVFLGKEEVMKEKASEAGGRDFCLGPHKRRNEGDRGRDSNGWE